MAPTAAAQPLGVGIIGAGTIVNRHAVAFLSLPHLARLIGVSDLDLSRAASARRRFGMQVAVADYRELLDRSDVDVVSICTRPDTHLRIVRDALAAGKHVLCEKPIAHTLADADEIIATCQRHPEMRVACLYQWRSDAAVRFARTLVEEGRLGRVLLADVVLRNWRPDAYYAGGARESWQVDGGGVLMVMGIHQLDALLALLGEPVEVAAQMDRYLRPSEGEDALAGWIRFRSGVMATLRFSVLDHRDYFQIELLAQRASLRVRGVYFGRWELEARDRKTERDLRALGRRQAPAPRFPASRTVVRALERLHGLRDRPWLAPRTWWHTPYVQQFLEAVRDGTEVPVSPAEARRSLELAMALYQSALTDAVVRLPLGPESPLYAGVDPKAMPWARARGPSGS